MLVSRSRVLYFMHCRSNSIKFFLFYLANVWKHCHSHVPPRKQDKDQPLSSPVTWLTSPNFITICETPNTNAETHLHTHNSNKIIYMFTYTEIHYRFEFLKKIMCYALITLYDDVPDFQPPSGNNCFFFYHISMIFRHHVLRTLFFI